MKTPTFEVSTMFIALAISLMHQPFAQYEGEQHLGDFGAYIRPLLQREPSQFQTGALYGHHFALPARCLDAAKAQSSAIGNLSDYIVLFEYTPNYLFFDFYSTGEPGEISDFRCEYLGAAAIAPVIRFDE